MQIDPDQFLVHNELAFICLMQKNLPQAAIHFRESLQLKPDQPENAYNLARLSRQQGNLEQAVAYWEQALQLRPDWPAVLNNLAWVRATAGKENLLVPKKALTLALRACELTEYEHPGVLGTLAAAQAANGDFDLAVATAEKAIELARQTKREKILNETTQQLDLYRAGQPYRQPSGRED